MAVEFNPGDEVALFEQLAHDGGWLIDGVNNVRVQQFSPLTDRNTRGAAAFLNVPGQPGSQPYMDWLGNLATLGVLRRSVELSMFPMPDGAVSIAWSANVFHEAGDPPEVACIHVLAAHRFHLPEEVA
jgi:hypothetical protein